MSTSASGLQSATAVKIYQRLLTYALPYWRMFALAIVGMVVYALTEPVFAAMMKPLLDGSFVEKNPDTIRLIPMVLLGIFMVRAIFGFLSSYCIRWVGRKVVADLRQEMFAKLLKMPTCHYDNTSSGKLLSKLIYNVDQVAQATTTALTILVRDTISLIGLLAWMLYLHLVLSMTFLLVGPVIALSLSYVIKRFRRISKNIQKSMGQITHFSEEVIEGHRVVKAFGGQAYEMENFIKVNEKNRHQQMKMVVTDNVSVSLIQLIVAMALSGIIYLSTLDSMREAISVGTFMSFVVAMGMLLGPIKRLTKVNSHIQKGIAAADSLFELLDTDIENDQGRIVLEKVKGEIQFQDVWHRYDENKAWALKSINLTIPAGKTVAFVGGSGGGKTTLVNLIPRFYEACQGKITLDGHNIEDLTLDSLRQQIALVSQDITLFNDSIANNIAYGYKRGASREHIEQAAKAAHILDFINSLPDGLDSLVGENGVLLSGGQRQRIAIARAILKDAPILILDEATAALDNESERHIQLALEELMKNRTTLVIAHRLSTIEKADRIVVMNQGEIVEQGTHQSLLKLNRYYAELQNK